jgi:hypothetical protein
MINIFVPLDISTYATGYFVDETKVQHMENELSLTGKDYIEHDIFHVLSRSPMYNSDLDFSKYDKKVSISPFRLAVDDIDLLDQIGRRLSDSYDDEIIIYITMSEHLACVLSREFWLKAVPNFNIVISDVWEPEFLDHNPTLSMYNVFEFIKECNDAVAPFNINIIKPNSHNGLQKWLTVNKIPASIVVFEYFLYDTWVQSGVTYHGSKLDNKTDFDINSFFELQQKTEKSKDLLLLNRTYKAHRAAIVNDLYKDGYLDNSFYSLQEINEVGEASDILKDFTLPILADSEPEHNISVDGFMQHDSVANYDWILKSKLYVGTESYMSVESQLLQQGYTHYPIRFISEKVFKPIAWGMPFVILGNAFSLLKVRQLGFKTFDGLIDESYDKETDAEVRYKMVLDSIKTFLDNPPDRDKVLEICKFNLDLFYSTDFQLNQFADMANLCVNNYYNFRRKVDEEFNQ